MPESFNSSRFKQIEIEFEQQLERRSKETTAVADVFVLPKMPEPLPHCPQCGVAYAPGAKRCRRCHASLVRK